MSNDITGINSQRTQQSGSRSSERVSNNASAAVSTATSSSGSGSDKVSLTSTAARLKDIERQLAGESPVDNVRVNEMKSAIANGEYDINTDRVADKIISFERGFDSNR